MIMKRFYYLIILFSAISVLHNHLYGQARSIEAAAEIAEAPISSLAYKDDALIVFNRQDKEGYTIISADEALPEVLGYSETGTFDPNDIPENMQYWMELMSRANALIKAGKMSREEIFAQSTETKEVSPLLKDISWGQRAPFNSKCPVINDSTCLAGCVATAIGMLMKYYEYPKQPTGYMSYVSTTRQLNLSMDFSQVTFEWDKIFSKYSTKQKDVSGEKVITTDAPLKYSKITCEANRGYLYCNISNVKLTNSGNDFEGILDILLYDSNGTFIQSIGEEKTFSLTAGYYYPNYHVNISLPSNIADGEYRVYLGCKLSDGDSWYRINSDGSQRFSYVTATKSGNRFTMLNETGICSYTNADAEAVGNLIYAIGVLSNMNYNTKSSGANTGRTVMNMANNFGYDKDSWIAYQEHFSSDDYENVIRKRLDEKHPILVSAHSGSSGHAFILDGYKAEQDLETYYHINWGWTGTSDGYFLITYLVPSEAGDGGSVTNYADDLSLYMDIFPDDGKTFRGPEIGYYKITTEDTELEAGDNTTINIDNLINVGCQTIKGRVYAFLVSKDGTEYNTGNILYATNWSPSSYYSSLNKTISIPTTLPSGQYRLILRAKQNSEEQYGEYHTKNDPILTITNSTGIIDVNKDKDIESEDIYYDILGRQIKHNLVVKKHIYLNKNHQKMIIR